jgi:hypothetical protein
MRRSSSKALLALVLVFALLPLGVLGGDASSPRADFEPGNGPFQRTWQRTDQPVATGAVARTWMWGPEANTTVFQEDYFEAPGHKRDVQYFDKSRMEITHPDAVDDGLFYVTNGLLVVELMTGQLQIGDDTFLSFLPADVNVAGDANDPNGPTYAALAGLRSAPPLADDATITQVVDHEGNVSIGGSLAAQGVTTGHRVQVAGIDHQIAAPFWDFMNSTGLVNDDGANVIAPLFQNPFYATGYPLIEAYWATVQVAGTPRLVLIQCFERRCLTYTPGNPAGFETEAGNVGQHYFDWRYSGGTQEPAFDVQREGLSQPRGIDIGELGNGDYELQVAQAGEGDPSGQDCMDIGVPDETHYCIGLTGSVIGTVVGGLDGLPSLQVGNEINGPHDMIVQGAESGFATYVLVGLGADPAIRDTLKAAFGVDTSLLGTIVTPNGDGGWDILADLAAYEAANNPDFGVVESNPWQFEMVDDGLVVTDAGANDLLHVAFDGTITTLAVFPDTLASDPDGATVPMQAVPTGLSIGPDGAYYVGEFTGYPFTPGQAVVWRVQDGNGDGDALDDGEMTVYAAGFTNIISIDFDSGGNLYVLEHTVVGLLNVDFAQPESLAGGLIIVAQDGTRLAVETTGVLAPTGLAISASGDIYVSNYGIMPNQSGQLVELRHKAAPLP